MGQSKGGGYIQKETVTPEQQTLIQKFIQQAGGNLDQAAQAYAQFLPGGGGGEAVSKAAHQRFQQQTIPSIMNAFGSDARSSSALNQALAAGAANLNTDIASMLAQMQLQAASGLGSLGAQQAGLGMTPLFAYLQAQPSCLAGAAKGALTGAGAGASLGPWGALGGGILGAGVGAL